MCLYVCNIHIFMSIVTLVGRSTDDALKKFAHGPGRYDFMNAFIRSFVHAVMVCGFDERSLYFSYVHLG